MADLIAVSIAPGVGAAIVHPDGRTELIDPPDAPRRLAEIEADGARWVWWNKDTAHTIAEYGVAAARCWDLAAVHRLIHGGWHSGPGIVWASVRGLDAGSIPALQPVDLFTQAVESGDPEDPLGLDGHLRPEWVQGGWAESLERLADWSRRAAEAQRIQAEQLAVRRGGESDHQLRHRSVTALSESAAEILCAELEAHGLPFDRTVGEQIVEGFVGRRPLDAAGEQNSLAELDAPVLAHLPPDASADLRSPDQVKSLLRRAGIEVPDTRAWRLEALRAEHPVVDALLTWRRAERMRTTFGFGWIDEHVGNDGRLRGRWSGSDGAAGRMTATAGLHNMPAEMRPAVAAEEGHVLVRADLGQIEPRVLAAVSGDARLAAATQEDDMYAPVAQRLRVDREIAKVAVLGAMYGQTTGKGAEALRGLEREYPVAMGVLRAADEAAQGGHDLWTYGGRRIRMSGNVSDEMSDGDVRSRAAARGRYGRNAIVQGAAAEFFKTWAVLVRLRGAGLGAQVVLCLHDELVVHTPVENGDATRRLVDSCLREAAHRWAPPSDHPVRFVAETSVIERWSQAK